MDVYNSLLIIILLISAGTWRPRDVPWRSLKGPNVLNLQGTFGGLLGDQHKTWWFDKKKVFLNAIVLLLHIYYRFLLEKQIFESSKWGRLQDPVMERPGHQIMGRSEDARGTSVIQSVLLRFVLHMQKII